MDALLTSGSIHMVWLPETFLQNEQYLQITVLSTFPIVSTGTSVCSYWNVSDSF